LDIIENEKKKNKVNSTVWENLEKLLNGEGWPRSSVYITKRHEELLVEHSTWPDRYLLVYICVIYIYIYIYIYFFLILNMFFCFLFIYLFIYLFYFFTKMLFRKITLEEAYSKTIEKFNSQPESVKNEL
jgi:hypothetical protein